MIKELFLAIIIGALLGFGVTGGYLTLHQKDQSQPPVIITSPTTIPTSVPESLDYKEENNNPTDKLKIDSPEDNLLVSNNSLKITGNAVANSQIVINTSTQSFMGKSDQEGLFSVPIKLDAGLNIIKISAIDSDGNQLDTELNITYSTTKI